MGSCLDHPEGVLVVGLRDDFGFLVLDALHWFFLLHAFYQYYNTIFDFCKVLENFENVPDKFSIHHLAGINILVG